MEALGSSFRRESEGKGNRHCSAFSETFFAGIARTGKMKAPADSEAGSCSSKPQHELSGPGALATKSDFRG